MINKFFESRDAILSAINGLGSILCRLESIIKYFDDYALYTEFFKLLEDPEWIKPLKSKGLFDKPKGIEMVEGGGISYPHWPASKYLARMASKAPEEVAEIFEGIETDNPSIIFDLLEAAKAMPAGVAVKLVPAVIKAANEGTLWMNFAAASDLCVHLFMGGEFDTAMELADTLFIPTKKKEIRKQTGFTQRDEYWYKDGAKKVIPVMMEKMPTENALQKICGWLNVVIEMDKPVDQENFYDISTIWRPAIEDHEQNRDYEIAAVLVGCVRDGFAKAINSKDITLDRALEIIKTYKYLVFRRLEIYLINEFAEQKIDLACETMLNKDFLDDHKVIHEYAMLLGKRWNLLSENDKDKWLSWIETGPDMTDYDETIKHRMGREATEEDRVSRKEYWKLSKLYWIRNHLEGRWKEFYEELLRKQGKPKFPDMKISASTWGPPKPIHVDELKNKTFEQVVKYVNNWFPNKDKDYFTDQTYDGMSAVFSEYVATNPELFSKGAKYLKNCKWIYIHDFMRQMCEAVKQTKDITLNEVINLCNWIIDNTFVDYNDDDNNDGDQFYRSWARTTVVDFIEEVCKATQNVTNKCARYSVDDYRELIWDIIKNLYKDASKSSMTSDDEAIDPRTKDYLDLGINSPRGKAVVTALEYARWVANHIKVKVEGKEEIIPDGFNSMPEVREMLEWQIEEENRTFEAMSVIGSRLGLIYWIDIDTDWLIQNTENIFRLNEIEKYNEIKETETDRQIAAGWAAWNAFLVWCSPHIEFYDAMKSQFEYAVEQSAKVEIKDKNSFHRTQPMFRLGEHLIVLHGRGQIDFNDDSLLKKFIDIAISDIRIHTMGFAGEWIDVDDDVEIPEELIKRFKNMWEYYWDNKGEADTKGRSGLHLFGHWFTCGRFDNRWSLEQLEKYIEKDPSAEPDDKIVKRLLEIIDTDELKVVNILACMCKGDKEGWHMYSYQKETEAILKKVMDSSNEDAKTVARDLIDYLGRKGYTKLGELLN